MKRLASYLESLPLAKQRLIKQGFISLIELPIIGGIYHPIYYIWIRRKASLGLTELDIETYNACNLRCTMCPYPNMTRKKVLMSMCLFKKIIDDAITSNIREVCLNFYNEPLLDPLLFERIKYAKSNGLTVMFTSNGCLLTEEKINALLDSGLDSVVFSVGGATKETYERIYVGADFEETKNNIIELIKKRNLKRLKTPLVTLYLVAQKENYRDLSEFRSFWKEFADKVNIGWVDARRTEGLLPEQLKLLKSGRIYPCRSIFEHMVVMSNAEVALCCFDYDGSVVLGDLNKQTISEVWNSDKIRKIRELHLSKQGDKIKLCRDTNCGMLYKEGAYWWWK